MDRREAILREMNLYPLWKQREVPIREVANKVPDAYKEDGLIKSGNTPNEMELPVQIEAEVEPAAAYLSQVGGFDWPQLKHQVRECRACNLRAGCTQTVFGAGDEQADWLFVGEGPGADEDEQGKPFVGQAGKLLDNMLMAITLKRGKNVYIGNIVKCRPPGNRNPGPEEIATCLPYLQRQIELIQPKMIVALGKVASNALLGREATLASLRGKLHDYVGIPLIVTYHPAYLLRSPSEKAKVWEDLCLAVKLMQDKH